MWDKNSRFDFWPLIRFPSQPKYDGHYIYILMDNKLNKYSHFYPLPSQNIDQPTIEYRWTLSLTDVFSVMIQKLTKKYCRSKTF